MSIVGKQVTLVIVDDCDDDNAIERLDAAIAAARAALERAEADRLEFIRAPERNVFETLEDARAELEYELLERAGEDCEGSYNCGADEYRQGFIVDGVRYVAILEPEYNRHDKRYYYVDGHTYRVEALH